MLTCCCETSARFPAGRFYETRVRGISSKPLRRRKASRSSRVETLVRTVLRSGLTNCDYEGVLRESPMTTTTDATTGTATWVSARENDGESVATPAFIRVCVGACACVPPRSEIPTRLSHPSGFACRPFSFLPLAKRHDTPACTCMRETGRRMVYAPPNCSSEFDGDEEGKRRRES